MVTGVGGPEALAPGETPWPWMRAEPPALHRDGAREIHVDTNQGPLWCREGDAGRCARRRQTMRFGKTFSGALVHMGPLLLKR